MAEYKHQITMSEGVTALSTLTETATVPVVFVTAPVNMTADPKGAVNKPIYCSLKSEAVNAFGNCTAEAVWDKYTAPQVIRTLFDLYAVTPVILVNVLDPSKHKTTGSESVTSVDGNEFVLSDIGILTDTISFTEETINKADCDFGFNSEGQVVVTYNGEETLSEKLPLQVSYDKLDPDGVKADDFIGGYDAKTNTYSGLELLDSIFTKFRAVPSIVAAPGYSKDKTLAVAMATKAANINGLFKASALVDLPTVKGDGNTYSYSEIAEYKNNNSLKSEHMNVLWPMGAYDGLKYFMSTQMIGVYMRTDLNNDDIPSKAPSNETIYIDSLIDEKGREVNLILSQCNYLNAAGITTAINFINGWVSHGVQTAAYPTNTDIKDNQISARRMFDYISNDFILSNWGYLDGKINRRLIDRIIDNYNIKLNSLVADNHLLGGRIEFLSAENTTTDLISGVIQFHLSIAPPPPAREIKGVLEYDTAYLESLFG